MAKLPMPEPPVAVADFIPMPTHAQLSSSSAAVDLPDFITGGVLPPDYLKFGLELPHLVQTHKLTGDKFPEVEGYPTKISAAVAAFGQTYRVVDGWPIQDLLVNATVRPYSKVFTRAYLTVRCLFCYSFV
jgi:hypothetical protein